MAQPPEKAVSATTSSGDSEASLSLSHKRRLRRRRAAKSTPVVPESAPEKAVPEPFHKMATNQSLFTRWLATPEPPAVMAAKSEPPAVIDVKPHATPVFMNLALEDTQAFKRHLVFKGLSISYHRVCSIP